VNELCNFTWHYANIRCNPSPLARIKADDGARRESNNSIPQRHLAVGDEAARRRMVGSTIINIVLARHSHIHRLLPAAKNTWSIVVWVTTQTHTQRDTKEDRLYTARGREHQLLLVSLIPSETARPAGLDCSDSVASFPLCQLNLWAWPWQTSYKQTNRRILSPTPIVFGEQTHRELKYGTVHRMTLAAATLMLGP